LILLSLEVNLTMSLPFRVVNFSRKSLTPIIKLLSPML